MSDIAIRREIPAFLPGQGHEGLLRRLRVQGFQDHGRRGIAGQLRRAGLSRQQGEADQQGQE